MKWHCPYKGCGGAELGARTSPRLGQLRQCPSCAKQWRLDGNPIPRTGEHNMRAVRA